MNVLLTSAGRRSYLVEYFKEAVGQEGKVYASNSEMSSALLVADESVITPLIYSDNYITFLLDYCKSNKIDILVPLFDIDLPVISASKQLFIDNGTIPIVSNREVIDICSDKYLTQSFLKRNGFNYLSTYLSVEEVRNAIACGELQYPVIVKPRYGMGSLGLYIADNEDELVVFYNKVKKTIQDTYLKYETFEYEKKDVIIQEYVYGQEYGADCINDLAGNYQTTVIREKKAMRAGETDVALMIDNPEIEKMMRDISKLTRHIGNLDVDIIKRGTQYVILEMNARFGGGYPFSHAAGINLPRAIIQWVDNLLTAPNYWNYDKGIEIYKDFNIIKNI